MLITRLHFDSAGEKAEYKWFSNAELSTDVSSRWGFPDFPLENYMCPLDDYVEVRAKVNIKAEVTNSLRAY